MFITVLNSIIDLISDIFTELSTHYIYGTISVLDLLFALCIVGLIISVFFCVQHLGGVSSYASGVRSLSSKSSSKYHYEVSKK